MGRSILISGQITAKMMMMMTIQAQLLGSRSTSETEILPRAVGHTYYKSLDA